MNTKYQLSSSADQLLLQHPQVGWQGHVVEVLESSLILGEEELEPGIVQVLDDVHDLVHLGLFHAILAGQPHLPGDEPGAGHGLTDLNPVPVEDGELPKISFWFHSCPLDIWRIGDPCVLVLDPSIGQQQATGLSSCSQIEICQPHIIWHFETLILVTLSSQNVKTHWCYWYHEYKFK